jgi:hypothetical protein
MRGLQLGHNLQPELSPLRLFEAKPEHVFFAADIERYRDVHHFVAAVAGFHPERVEEDDGISGIERRFRHSRTSLRTASMTRLIRSGETSDAIKLL